MSVELPAQLSASVTVKVGQPYSATRSVYGAPIGLTLVVDERYSVFRAKVKERVGAIKEILWEDDGPILLRPTANTPQTKYEPLTSDFDGFLAQLAQLWKHASKRKQGRGSFTLELYIYVQKVATLGGIRRATETRVASAAAAISDHVEVQGATDDYGPASRRYWAITHARQPEGTAVNPPSTTTFEQLRYVDWMQRAIDRSDEEKLNEPEFVQITCRLNGGLIPTEMRVSELRRTVGLPAYPLCPPFGGRTAATEVPGSFENIEDEDHALEEDFDIE